MWGFKCGLKDFREFMKRKVFWQAGRVEIET